MSRLANQHGAINLSQGFPNFDCSPKLQELVKHYMDQGFNQYAPMIGAEPLRKAIVEKVKRLHNISLDVNQEITITAGATQAIFTVINALINNGDEVIIIEPAYDSYRPSIELCGAKAIAYPLKAPNFEIDWQQFKKLITDKTKMIIVNTPHNPSGKTLKASDFAELEQLVDHSDILILSDEVYEHLVYDGAEHQSILKFPNLRKRSLVTYSFGKTFHNTGWKMGYCIAPPLLTNEFRKVHQFNVFSVNHPIQMAIAAFLQNPEEYEQLPSFYQQKRDFLLSKMKDSKLKPIPCEGTYFQLFDYSQISDKRDTEFANWLTTEVGVATIPISPFYKEDYDQKVIRVCFAKTEDLLEQAAQKLCQL